VIVILMRELLNETIAHRGDRNSIQNIHSKGMDQQLTGGVSI
jgi:hypothetical protein